MPICENSTNKHAFLACLTLGGGRYFLICRATRRDFRNYGRCINFAAGKGYNDLQLWKLLKVEAGLGQEALEEAGPVLHPPQPGLDQRGQLADVVLDQVGQRPFQAGPGWLSRFVIVHGSLDRRLLAHRLSAGTGCSGWWSGPGSCGHAAREVDRRGRRGRGHLLQMTAAMSVPDGELWASFPEVTRNDILGLLGMLLERWAVSAGLAAEGSGGEHGAAG
jgi:hypothetical protein